MQKKYCISIAHKKSITMVHSHKKTHAYASNLMQKPCDVTVLHFTFVIINSRLHCKHRTKCAGV